MIDLGNTRVLLVVFGMPGCGACDEFVPKFLERVTAFQKQGAPFRVVQGNDKKIEPGEIPVMLYDAAAENEGLQDFADSLGISATPTTCMLTRRSGTTKIEGAISPAEVDVLLQAAVRANR
jgi:hypothetical protein